MSKKDYFGFDGRSLCKYGAPIIEFRNEFLTETQYVNLCKRIVKLLNADESDRMQRAWQASEHAEPNETYRNAQGHTPIPQDKRIGPPKR